mmetsp:Transcript_19744/g.44829  ORF Transcript_19744/g.44829 Transcript_19744/m.44829 type:complete len:616 (-) Transcript_19744:219-2066(-)|eukprot:CAMPEP_0113315270 /NCGR_PEP_ID=MMETSP0010_2-20120614/11005_1 /TAXON_ID=216773 ORGANISM="Corethron hystrix, Strain 308" /NCGR_SAMPLE_ID=MMETSP0010_2 /ASSEMBLY_ACC=CAM_ASM_000155 /LENGTH=615 /DNA_ID=CAMNT_0000171737 /DNA_START=165 /DNA_END=2012 /DNA_ORIENTATION=- /assembly_acc=CAM_ASM_000155
MSSSNRDPYPMSSEAAASLAGSVNDGVHSSWKGMVASTATAVPPASSSFEKCVSDREGLTGETKGQKLNNDDDSASDSDDELVYPRYRKNALEKVAQRLFKRLYGDVEAKEVRRILALATTLFFMIGGYWLLRSLKDTVLTALCGVEYIPKAKMLSVFVVLGVVFIYNKLVDLYPKHTLFYIFGMFYFLLFTGISILLRHPSIGLANQIPSPYRILGWVSYCSIESFGSVMVALFWSFVNSITSLESAKASYGFLVAAAQVGSILGPTVVTYSATIGIPNCYFIGACCMLCLQITMYTYVSVYGSRSPDGGESKKKKENAGVMEGIYLFVEHHYIKGIFAISCLFMVEVTIVDYTMKVLAKEYYSTEFPCHSGEDCWDSSTNMAAGLSIDAQVGLATFMGLFGQATNTLSFLFSLLGTSAVIRTLGLRLTLLFFPSLMLIVIIIVRMVPTLWVVFGAMMLLKGFSYALNNPTKEILYQPTSSAVKFKAKSWIDIFGARGSKALGSLVTNAFSESAENLVNNGSVVAMFVASFLIFNARYMGQKFDEYMDSGYVVGGENELPQGYSAGDKDTAGLELAVGQNEVNDTSCGIEEEGQSIDETGGKSGSGELCDKVAI